MRRSTLWVRASIEANDDPTIIGGFSTDYVVEVRDGLGSPVSGATVTIRNVTLGSITLVEASPSSGEYRLTGNTFPGGDFQLDVVRSTDNVRGVVLGGPSVHAITAPVAGGTASANQPLTVRWTVPSRAQSAEVETQDFGPISVPDTGAYVIAAFDNPPRPDQRVRVYRFNEVNIAGGLPGSRMRVEVRRTVEPVAVQ